MEIPYLKLPIDLPQIRTFRILAERLDFNRALSAWYLLYQDLAYRAEDGQPVGRIPLAEHGELEKLLGAEGVAAVVESHLLERDEDCYVCQRFIAAHQGMASQSDVARKGGLMKSFVAKQRRLVGQAYQQSLAILPEKFVDENGHALPEETIDRVTRLIITCDNALGKPSRPPVGFKEGLIQGALRVTRDFSDEQIEMICRDVVLHRGHPRLATMTTERLLEIFGNIVRELKGE